MFAVAFRRGIAVVVACAAMGLLAHAALADATPIQLLLLYVPKVSNTGTTAASGIAELVLPEGEVRVTAADLPHLDGDKVYVVWVVNSGTNAFQRLGSFNAAPSTGAVHYENVLPEAIPNHQWNLLLLTVEDNADAKQPSQRHSIAGVFPRADNEPLPGVLPNTGGDVPVAASCEGEQSAVSNQQSAISNQLSACGGADWLLKVGLPALTLTLGLAAGYSLCKRRISHAS